MNPTRINIALIPTLPVAHHAAYVSALLAVHKSYFVLKDTGPFPHITLYMTDIPEDKLDEAYERLERAQLSSVELVAQRYRAKESGYVDIPYNKNEALLALHHHIIELLNPLRIGIPAFKEHYESFTEAQRTYTDLYGYPDVDALYDPHLTLSRVAYAPSATDLAQLPQDLNFSHTPTSLGVFIADEHGACVRLLKNIPLHTT